jgi:Tol biopolymer transport system component
MTLPSGTKLGPYEILSPLGAGGMGEVYKARDTRLERTVAVKVLPSHLASSPESRQRFEREAKTISQLSHPHICALYDVGREGETEYLVMELLEGETLSERLAKGALPLEQTLRYGTEMADALDKAHRQGIVHRDLKPGNVMLTKSGVKLLDFGLAKAFEPPAAKGSLTALPTKAALTQEGTILGTFQYMAPEQLEGKEADARTDIFALGSVLYEMATGKKAFAASSQASLITAIMSADPPPIATVQPMSPPALDRVVKVCLSKDPEDRWQSAHDVAGQLEWIGEGSAAGIAAPVVARRRNRERLAWTAAAILGVAAALATLGYVRRAPAPPATMRFQIFPTERTTFDSLDTPAAISPDGRQIVFGQNSREGANSLWLRSIDSVEVKRIEGTEGAYDPFWSPDSRFVGFGNNDQQLRKVEVSGGIVQRICEMNDGRGATWNRDNVILFTTSGGSSPILRISASGGAATAVTELDKSRGEIGHWRPEFLPDGKHFLFFIRTTEPQKSGLAVGSLDSKTVQRFPEIDVSAKWAPPGAILFVRDGALMARRFDVGRLAFIGEAVPVANNVEYGPTWADNSFSVSSNGVLLFQSGGAETRNLVWFDRTGRKLGVLGDVGQYYESPRFSPDGKLVAVQRVDLQTHNTDLWTIDTTRGVGSRLTSEPWLEEDPVWSPDSSRVAYDSNREGLANLYVKAASGVGDAELLLRSDQYKSPSDWSPDGRHLLYTGTDPKSKGDIWALPLFGDRKPFPLVATLFDEIDGRFSPEGRWFAYESDESGKREIYVQPFPPNGSKWQVSVGGGIAPRWRGDGIFYRGADGKRKLAPVKKGETFEAGAPQDLFPAPESWGHDITPDGQRFLFNLPAGDAPASPITVVLNWAAGIKELQK